MNGRGLPGLLALILCIIAAFPVRSADPDPSAGRLLALKVEFPPDGVFVAWGELDLEAARFSEAGRLPILNPQHGVTAFDPWNRRFFFLASSFTRELELISVDAVSGAVLARGALHGFPLLNFVLSLEYDPVTGELLGGAMLRTSDPWSLAVRIDPRSGRVRPLGATFLPPLLPLAALDWRGRRLFLPSMGVPAELHVLDAGDGARRASPTLALADPHYLRSIEYDPVRGTLLGLFSERYKENSLVSIDLEDGRITGIGGAAGASAANSGGTCVDWASGRLFVLSDMKVDVMDVLSGKLLGTPAAFPPPPGLDSIAYLPPRDELGGFQRGDPNGDGSVDLGDALGILFHLFAPGGDGLSCSDAADGDDSGRIDISDAVRILGFLFLGGASLPAPGPSFCGPDPTGDALDCRRFDPCR